MTAMYTELSSRLLIVDCDRPTRTLIRNVLSEMGYSCAVAADPQRAMRVLHRQPVDLLVMPRVPSRIQRALVVQDACLLVGAAFALSWCFLLAPIYENSQGTPLGKLVNLSYPLGDLAIFFALTLIWLRNREYEVERAVMVLLIQPLPVWSSPIPGWLSSCWRPPATGRAVLLICSG